MNETPEREITVFTEALQLAPSERLAYLERVGASDPDLRRQVEALLRAFEGGGDLLGEAAPGVSTQTLQGPVTGESAGDRIGRYKLLQQIGEGGYGVVFMAEQVEAEAMHRKVFVSWRTRVGATAPRALYEFEGLVRTLLVQRRLSDAERLLNGILTPAFLKDTLVQRSEKANLLIQRVEILGRQKSWHEATTDAALLLELRPSDHYRYHQLAGLLMITREHPTYRKLCQRILTTFGDTKDPYIAERAAADCLLLPDSGADMQLVDQLATRAIESGRREAGWNYFQACKALSDYRQGNLSSAMEWAANAIDGGETLASARACAVKAIAQWKLGAKDSARAMLAKGNELAPNEPAASSTDLGDTWLAWIFARISLDEASELIGPAPTEIKQSTNP